MTCHSKSMGINMELVPLCSYNSFHSSGKLSTRFLSVCVNFCLFIRNSICGVRHRCWTRRPAS
ncbi:hypothetical protein SRHO_G00084490 [Serrasalmus rhombeus]